MKKITLFVALLCSISAFSTRYLVQGSSGTNTWRAATTGEVRVTLSSSLRAWFAGQTMAANDQVWLAAGTYIIEAPIYLRADVSIYGSFAGTETSIAARSKVTGGKPWEFSNQTIIDGDNEDIQGLITANSANASYLDGLMITRFNKLANESAITEGVAVLLKKNCTLQNSIVSYNSFIGSTTVAFGCKGVGVDVKGGHILNSYIHHNDCLNPVGGISTPLYGAGITLWGSAIDDPISVIKGCTIESNTATLGGAGIFLGNDGSTRLSGGDIEDCILKSNSVLASTTQGGGAIFGSAGGSISQSLMIKNCQFIENSLVGGLGGGAIYFYMNTVPISIEGCSFIGNVASPVEGTYNGGGAVYVSTGLMAPIKNCIFRDNIITTSCSGSAIRCNPTVTMQNCVFANNSSKSGASATAKFQSADSKLLNSTIVNNETSGTGAGSSSVDMTAGARTVICNSLFMGNLNSTSGTSNSTVITYNATDNIDLWGTTGSANNIKSLTATNTFVSPTSFRGAPTNAAQKAESAAANWQLLSSSPAVNAGTDLSASDVTTDILGVARPVGAAYDMGAYECTVTGIKDITLNFNCFSHNQHIELRELTDGQHVTIYSITGQIKNEQFAYGSSLSIGVSKGLYLVKVDAQAIKIIVQ